MPRRSVALRNEKCQQKVQALFEGQYLSQTDLGEEIKISQGTISKFLNRQRVDRRIFIEICAALGIEDWRSVAATPYSMAATPYQEEDKTQNSGLEKIQQTQTISTLVNPAQAGSLEYPDAGQMASNSYFYIERPPIEQQCFEEISSPPSAPIIIKAPEKMGKSSLLARIIQKAKSQGETTVVINFELGEKAFFSNLSAFLHWFCESIILDLSKDSQELGTDLQNRLQTYWKLAVRSIGPKAAVKDYFEKYLLPQLQQPLTLALEEVDILFEYPEIYKDFFGILRVMSQSGNEQKIWQKLRLVIVHSTEAYVPMNISESPFNIGIRFELPEFTPEQILDLAKRHQLEWSNTEVEKLRNMIGGHPFLVRLSLYQIARHEITLTHLLETAPTLEGIFSSHLRHIESILIDQEELGAAMKKIVNSTVPGRFSNPVRYKLKALGLVNLLNDIVTLRCKLYQLYFQNCW